MDRRTRLMDVVKDAQQKLASEELILSCLVLGDLTVVVNIGGFEFEFQGATKDRFLAMCEYLLDEHEVRAEARAEALDRKQGNHA